MKRAVLITVLVLVSIGVISCGDKDQVYKGMYGGFQMSDQNRRTEDPSSDPAQEPGQGQPSYEEYKRERALLLRSNDSSDSDVLSE